MNYYLELKFKKRKIYTDGIEYYRYMYISNKYEFEKVKFHEKSNRFITTHVGYRFTANEAGRLTEI